MTDMTPEAIEKLKAEVMTSEHLGGLWVTAEDYLAARVDADMAQALVVERAAEICDQVASGYEAAGDAAIGCGVRLTGANIRRLAPASGGEALAALRAQLDALKSQKWDVQHTDTMNDFVSLGMERDALAAKLAQAEAQVAALRLQLDQKDALYDSGFQAGVKLGWNFGVLGDEAGFQAATSSTEHVSELKRVRAALAAAEGAKE